MQRKAVRFVIFWETNRPWQRANSPIATTVQQATDATKDATQGDAWSQHIGQLPQRQFFPPCIKHKRHRRTKQAAVIDQSAMLHHEYFRQPLAGEFFAPVSD